MRKIITPFFTTSNICFKYTGNQAVSLRSFPLFRSAVSVGRTVLHFTDTSQHKKIRQQKNAALFFLLFVPHLHTVSSCVRSGYYIHNTASFRYTPQATFLCIPAVLCLSPFVVSAVALSHRHRGWLRSVKNGTVP